MNALESLTNEEVIRLAENSPVELNTLEKTLVDRLIRAIDEIRDLTRVLHECDCEVS